MRALKHPEEVREATVVVEATAVLGGVIKKHGVLSHIVSCRSPGRPLMLFVFDLFSKLHVRWGRPSVA